MKTSSLKAWGVVLLMVIAASLGHGFFDRDHLCLHHQPAGRSLSHNTSVERETCLCFTHGYFVPVVVVPQARYPALEIPMPVFSESPRTSVVGDIDHPPLS